MEEEIEDNNNDLLCEILEREHMVYSVTSDLVIIHSKGDDLITAIEDDVEFDLIASLRDGYITTELDLIKLNENEQTTLDSVLLNALMRANYIINTFKFGFSSYGLCLSLDFDTKTFNSDAISSGYIALLDAIQIYSDILSEWFDFVEETLNPNFKRLNKNQAEQYIEYLQKVDLQKAQIEGDKETEIRGLIMRIIKGFAKKLNLVRIDDGLIPSILGVPKKSIEPLLTTLTKDDDNRIFS